MGIYFAFSYIYSIFYKLLKFNEFLENFKLENDFLEMNKPMNHTWAKSGLRPGIVGPANSRKMARWAQHRQRGGRRRGVGRILVRSSWWVPPRKRGGTGQGLRHRGSLCGAVDGGVVELGGATAFGW
jgi:hypothetical protein